MTIQWFDALDPALAACQALTLADELAIGFLRERLEMTGYCPACSRPVDFHVSADPVGGSWRNFFEGMVCPCGTNGRTRLITMAWRELRQRIQPVNSLIFERVTSIFERFAAEDPGLVGCEYLGPDKEPGQSYPYGSLSVLHEDMLNLSVEDASLDVIMHFDVLEHVPDHRRALRECFRALRPGGAMLFTLPFFHELEDHVVRARVKDGGIEHLLPPAFHGNPVGDGALVFIHPGRELLADLSDVGFKTAVGLGHNLGFGIISNGCPWPEGHTWPLVFLSKKSSD